MKKLVSCLLAVILTMTLALGQLMPAAAEEAAITVTDIQKYGNLVLSVTGTDLLASGLAYGDVVTVSLNGQEFDMPVGSNYSDVDQGSMICRVVIKPDTQEDMVILAINMGDLATKAGLAVKESIDADPGFRWNLNEGVAEPIAVGIALKEKGGYYDQWVIHQLSRSENREDYPELSDAEYANFRAVTTTGMGKNALYRSSSPVNPEINRNREADAAAAAAGVRTFINLADNEETMKAYEGFNESYYAGQKIIPLNLGVDFSAEEFRAGLARGVRFIAENDGPYLVHCTEGKDRAGFVSAVLECLAGATADEVVADYMVTFYNYYGVKPEEERYGIIADSNIRKSLAAAFGVESIDGVDLAAAAKKYLIACGVPEEEVGAALENLTRDYLTPAEAVAAGLTLAGTAPSTDEIDKYGDVRLSLTTGDFQAAGIEYADLVTVRFLDQELTVPVIPAYRYVAAKGTALVVWPDDESTPAELEVFNGSFAATYGLADVTRNPDKTFFVTAREGVTFPVDVTISLAEKNGYRDEYAIFDLTRSDERMDYPALSDAEFANFRAVSTTGFGEGRLYRSSSPVNPSISRNAYADKAAEEAGIKTFLNLSDDQASAEAYEGYADTYYSRQQIVFLGLGVDFTSQTNRDGLAEGLRALTTAETPILIHCNEGQDRAGFVSAVLECLMGASLDEVVADYMVTFHNYYGVEPGTEQYSIIANNIQKNLRIAFGVEDLSAADLQAEAVDYLQEIGVSAEDVAALQAKLGA